ncbi:hypothetical protein ACOMHN_030402 [Nucella lapillus]
MNNTTETINLSTDAKNETSFPLHNITFWDQAFQLFARTHELIWNVGAPTLLVFGVFGNVMIILIMRRFSKSSLTIFFQVLAWSDLLVLTVSLLPLWLKRQFGIPHIEDLGPVPCKIAKVIVYTTGVLSPSMLVALTMQRAASVLWPHRVNVVWTKRKSRVVAFTLIIIITLIHSPLFVVLDTDEELCYGGITICCPVMHFWFYNVVWPWLDLIEFSLLPFVLLILNNSILIWKLAVSVRTGEHLQQTAQDSRQKKASSLTVTLLIISGSFFLLTTPLSIYFISETYVLLPAVQRSDLVVAGRYLVYWIASNMLWYANSAVNFYLYCLTEETCHLKPQPALIVNATSLSGTPGKPCSLIGANLQIWGSFAIRNLRPVGLGMVSPDSLLTPNNTENNNND